MYIFDLNTLKQVVKVINPERFPGFHKDFKQKIRNGSVVSVREVYNEIIYYGEKDELYEWADENREIFHEPTEVEQDFVREIFRIKHYCSLVCKESILRGRPVADPFLIAKAKIAKCILVTEEKYKENASKIPNICKRFEIICFNLEKFMRKEEMKY